MKKKLTNLKTVFLFLFAVFLLQGCRTEDLSASSNSTTEKRAVLVRKVFPKEFQKIKNLNEKFEVSSKKLSQQSISGKNILDGAVIDSTFAMETTDGKSISYTFAVYRNNQKDYIENLVLQKNVDDTEFKSFLYKYKRKGLIGYDANNIEVYKIETSTSSNSRMSYTDKTYSNGCYDIIVTTVDCGEGGHHTNGQYCPALGYKVPSDYVTVRNNCSGGGDNDGTDTGYPSGNTGTGGSYGNTGGGGQTTTTTPVATTPKWNWGRTSVVNFLGLTSEQLNFINNSAQDEFRAQMLLFISNNGIEDPLANPSEEFLSTEVKSLGQWMVNYAMTHSDFLNSEFRNVFLNADLDFLQWSKSFLIQNPNTSWSQFINNKHDGEPNSSIDIQDNLSGNYDENLYENFDFENQQALWPTINTVIPIADFVGWNSPGINRNCMDYAKAQIAKKGYKISNYYDVDSKGSKQTFQIYTEQNGVNLNDLYKGVSYLKYALSKGIPVIVGVDDSSKDHGNIDNSTDHFVVIVGMGTDAKGQFFRFFDNASGNDPQNQGANPENKLYYNYSRKIFTGKTYCSEYRNSVEHDYILTMIRKSK